MKIEEKIRLIHNISYTTFVYVKMRGLHIWISKYNISSRKSALGVYDSEKIDRSMLKRYFMIMVKIILFMLLWILIGLIICLTLDIIFSVRITNTLFVILLLPLYLLILLLRVLNRNSFPYIKNIKKIWKHYLLYYL